MQEIDEQVALLLYKRVSGEELEGEEIAALDRWLDQSAHHRALLEELLDETRMGEDVKALLAIDEDAALKKLQGRIAFERKKARIVSPVFVRYAAAAIIIVGAVLGAYFMYGGPAGKGQAKKDAFHGLMITHRKETFIQPLPDGSIVWMNAATKIIYSKESGAAGRSVILEGEAYFDIRTLYGKSGEKIPFNVIVAKNGIERARVDVLGTQFNISAYPEEDTTRITLLKGQVLLQLANKTPATSLQPGQTAELDKNGTV
ncbi:MAG TPA: FecR family protein, partial [Chitinophagaceae bacterium]|nr:FecR family protein [Chitinophagaceae bacterium]